MAFGVRELTGKDDEQPHSSRERIGNAHAHLTPGQSAGSASDQSAAPDPPRAQGPFPISTTTARAHRDRSPGNVAGDGLPSGYRSKNRRVLPTEPDFPRNSCFTI